MAGLPVDPDRASRFLLGCTLVPLHSVTRLARIGRITLASSPDEILVFNRIFEAWFCTEQGFTVDAEGEEETARERPVEKSAALLDSLPGGTGGQDASGDEVLRVKALSLALAEAAALERIKKAAAHLATQRSRTWRPASRGMRINLAGTAKEARRHWGETLDFKWLVQARKPRRILLLIDISGSMKAQSEMALHAAYQLTACHPRVESFCLGTRLTRITGNLRQREKMKALGSLGTSVFDFDGGTRLGEGLNTFLNTPAYAALVRGAMVIVISDGLERGDHAPMAKAVARFGRLSRHLFWFTPLAGGANYMPATRGLAACLPHIDWLGNAATLGSLALSLEKLPGFERQTRGQALRLFKTGRNAA